MNRGTRAPDGGATWIVACLWWEFWLLLWSWVSRSCFISKPSLTTSRSCLQLLAYWKAGDFVRISPCIATDSAKGILLLPNIHHHISLHITPYNALFFSLFEPCITAHWKTRTGLQPHKSYFLICSKYLHKAFQISLLRFYRWMGRMKFIPLPRRLHVGMIQLHGPFLFVAPSLVCYSVEIWRDWWFDLIWPSCFSLLCYVMLVTNRFGGKKTPTKFIPVLMLWNQSSDTPARSQ